jgi:hypothetical protein
VRCDGWSLLAARLYDAAIENHPQIKAQVEAGQQQTTAAVEAWGQNVLLARSSVWPIAGCFRWNKPVNCKQWGEAAEY